MSTTVDYDTIRATAESLPETLHIMLHIAAIAPAVLLDPESPMHALLGDDGRPNDLGRAVSAWLVVTGDDFTPAAITRAKAVLREVDIEVCDGCHDPEPNVGNWSGGRRFCGGCKVRETFARPGFVDQDDPEWSLMWAALGAADGNTIRECPETGQVWQYMGTQRETDGVVRHCFRHRHHPRVRDRVSVALDASAEFSRRPDVLALADPRSTTEDIPW